MFRCLAIAGLLAALPALQAAAADNCPRAVAPPEVDKMPVAFMDMLKVGKGTEAVANVIASSPLWTQRPGVKEQMTGQVDAAIRAYGPVVDYERACSEAIGTTVFRQYYLARHRDMVTRWEFDLVRTGSGWQMAYFGFNDQVPSWF